MMKNDTFLYLMFIIGIFLNSCSDTAENKFKIDFSEKINLDNFEDNYTTFFEQFNFVEKKAIHFPDSINHAFSKAANLIITDDFIITIDQMLSQIHLFDVKGEYISSLGRDGRGPGEYSFLQFWEYHENILYLYDNGLKKFSLISMPELKIKNEFTTEIRISDFSVVDDKIVAITPPSLNGGGIISLIDLDRNSVVDRIHTPEDLKASIYFARSSTGDMAKINDKDVLVLYPDQNYLYRYEISADSIIPKTEYTFGNFHNSYRPKIQHFPENLNPYGSSPEHREWDESQTRLHWLLFLQPNIISMIGTIYEEDESVTYFMNAYNMNGEVLFEGLDLSSDSLSIPLYTQNQMLIFPIKYDDAEASRSEFEFYLAKTKE